MGINFNVNMKQDYSYLFQGLSGNKGSNLGNLNFLSDYASIKNGSYGKLLKAYYAKDKVDSSSKTTTDKTENKTDAKTTSTATDSAETLAKIQKSADELKESADKLIAKGKDSLFSEKDITTKDENGVETTSRGYDVDAIYGAVSDFVNDYNKLINDASDSTSNNVLNKALTLVNQTAANKNLLGKVGITLNEDDTLSIDEKAFKSANMTTVKSLFNNTGSYAYKASAQASLIDFAAENESSKANTYTVNGTYSNNYSMGSIMDTLF